VGPPKEKRRWVVLPPENALIELRLLVVFCPPAPPAGDRWHPRVKKQLSNCPMRIKHTWDFRHHHWKKAPICFCRVFPPRDAKLVYGSSPPPPPRQITCVRAPEKRCVLSNGPRPASRTRGSVNIGRQGRYAGGGEGRGRAFFFSPKDPFLFFFRRGTHLLPGKKMSL